jgi:hypothetical protein
MDGNRKLHAKDLRNMYTLPCIIRAIKSRRMSRNVYKEKVIAFKTLSELLKGRNHVGEKVADVCKH